MAEPINYTSAVETIKTAILQGQYQAAKDVNRVQLALYFAIGRYISKNTRKKFWGQGALGIISEQLKKELPGLKGFSESNLKNMRKFYENWIILDANSTDAIVELQNSNSTDASVELQKVENKIDINNSITISNVNHFPIEDFFKLPFSHHLVIVEKVKDLDARYYYIHRAVSENMPERYLSKIITEEAYEKRGTLPNNFNKTISDAAFARKAVMMFKDEYLLDFINVEQIGERDIEDVDEKVLEQQIVHNIKNFIMKFGHDFAFLGSQYEVEALGHKHYIDLLFYNRELACLVAVELKSGDFKNAYLGQLNGYLAILDDFVRKPNENPSVGIVLCKNADKNYAEYMVRTYDNPMGVATFKTAADMPEKFRKALPDIEELKKLL
ncbi:MAG: DUF1016 family protein [Bacteroidales bacterium]|nr:DUF1016 family protein [Bacteroidales bacterium]